MNHWIPEESNEDLLQDLLEDHAYLICATVRIWPSVDKM